MSGDKVGYRLGPMADRQIRLITRASEQELQQYIRNRYSSDFLVRRFEAAQDVTYEQPVDPDPDPDIPGGLPELSEVGPPDIGALVPMTWEQVYATPAGQVINGKHIIGQGKPRVDRHFTNCLIEGTTGQGTITNGILTEVAAPRYVIHARYHGVSVRLDNCIARKGQKVVYGGRDVILNDTLLEEGGEDLIYVGYGEGDVKVSRCILRRTGNLLFHATLGWSTSKMHADLAQIRGLVAGKILEFLDSILDGERPSGAEYSNVNRAILAQTAENIIQKVIVRRSLLSGDSNFVVGLRDKGVGHGPISEAILTDNLFKEGYISGATNIQADSLTATGNTHFYSGANIDALIQNGGPWNG